MTPEEKPYISVLRYLFEKGDIQEIKDYILKFNENDDDFDIFIQKLQELVKSDNIDIIEDMILDESLIEMIKNESKSDFDFDDDQDFENYLIGDESEYSEYKEFADVPDVPDDELSIENLKKDVGEQSTSTLEDIAGKFGIEDLSK